MISIEERNRAWRDYRRICELLEIERERPLTSKESGLKFYYNWRFGRHIDKINHEKEYQVLKEIMQRP